MSGSDAATLAGLAIPVSKFKHWDHTYVQSSCGWTWACWGASSKGQHLDSGLGSSFIANCISKPRGTAGIDYLITGVCHQTANRILSPALTLVSRARGYRYSERAFGDFGRDAGAWRATLVACYSAAPGSDVLEVYDPPDSQSRPFEKGLRMPGERTIASLDEVLNFVADRGDDATKIHDICREANVTTTLVEEKALARETEVLRKAQSALAAELENGTIDRSGYVEEFRSILGRFAEGSQRILGHDRFVLLYGEAAYEPEGLIDEDAFLQNGLVSGPTFQTNSD